MYSKNFSILNTNNLTIYSIRYEYLSEDSNQKYDINILIEKIVEAKKEKDKKRRNELQIMMILTICLITVLIFYAYIKIYNQRRRKLLLASEISLLKKQINVKYHDEIRVLAQKNDSTFLVKFREVYPAFINTLLQINPELGNSELTFCALIRLHFTTEEIAKYTFVQSASVRQRKRRLKKRLKLSQERSLNQFIHDIKLY